MSFQTPAERRRARVRHAIIAAAGRMFGEQGEAGVSIRRLAEEINYSPASIYKYFDSKEAILDELKETFFEGLQARILETVTANKDAAYDVMMRECIVQYVKYALSQSHHYAAAFSAVTEAANCEGSPDVWDVFVQTRKGIAFGYLVDTVKRGQKLGVFDSNLCPELSAKSIWASCHGMALLLMSIPGMRMYQSGVAADGEHVLRHHADIITRGLMPSQSLELQNNLQDGLSQ